MSVAKMKQFLLFIKKELLFSGSFLLALLFSDYWLIALHDSALLYAKHLPQLTCLKYPFFAEMFVVSIYYFFNRSRAYFWVVFLAHFVLLSVLAMVYFTTGTFFTTEILCLVYDTTLDEILGFITEFASISSVATIVLCVIVLVASIWGIVKVMPYVRNRENGSRWIFSIFMLICLALLPIIYFGRWYFSQGVAGVFNVVIGNYPIAAVINTYLDFSNSTGDFVYDVRHTTPPPDSRVRANLEGKPIVGVLVIGESAIRSHHSVYGYDRKTTPFLESYRKDMVYFDDALCVMPLTIIALKYWLTDLDFENKRLNWTIFDVLKKAGYRIKVLTNQNKSGWADSPLQMIYSKADSVKYMHEENFSSMNYDDGEKSPLDEILIPSYEEELQSAGESRCAATLIVLHLYGSHEPFNWRYPKETSRVFLDDATMPDRVNEYDTSILYTDSVLNRVVESLSKLSVPAYMLYFSDHGQVCDYDEEKRTPYSEHNSAYEVPFMVYGNASYQKEYATTFQRMQRAVHVPFQADRAHWGMLEIMLVETDASVDDDNFLSEKFVAKPRTKNEGRLLYEKD